MPVLLSFPVALPARVASRNMPVLLGFLTLADERDLGPAASVLDPRNGFGYGTIVSFSSGGIVIVAFFRSAARAGAEMRSRNSMYTGAGVLANASATRTASGPSRALSPGR